MTTIALPQNVESEPSGRGGVRPAVWIALTAWLVLVVSFGAAGAFVPALPGRLPCPLRSEWRRRWCSSSRGCGSRNRSANSCSRWIFGSLRESRPGVGQVWASYPSMRTRCSRLCSPFQPASETWPSGITAPWIILALVRQPDFACRPHIHPLECPRDTGPPHRHQHRHRECPVRNRRPRRDQHRPNGESAAAAGPGVPGAVIPYAARSGADAEPETYPQRRIKRATEQVALPWSWAARPPILRRGVPETDIRHQLASFNVSAACAAARNFNENDTVACKGAFEVYLSTGAGK